MWPHRERVAVGDLGGSIEAHCSVDNAFSSPVCFLM